MPEVQRSHDGSAARREDHSADLPELWLLSRRGVRRWRSYRAAVADRRHAITGAGSATPGLKAMKAAIRKLREWWWLVAAVLGVVIFALWQILKPKGGGSLPDEPVAPKFAEKAKAEVERVRLEGEVEKAKVRATGDAQRKEIEVIEEKAQEDPVQARKDMAAWLARNL